MWQPRLVSQFMCTIFPPPINIENRCKALFLLICLHTLYAYTILSPNFQIKNMYKSMLQELCQKRSWKLPVYKTVKDGLDHKPEFTATVTVNDSTFESPEKCASSKEAQNVAARVAFNHFSSLANAPQQQIPVNSRRQELSSSGSSASTTNLDIKAAKSGEVEQNRQTDTPLAEIPTITIPTSMEEGLMHTYKNRLQIYAQKRNLTLPAYSCEIVGPEHGRRYKSKVTVDGKSFEAPYFFSTLKDAEHGAAKVAFESLSLHLMQEDEVLYKSLLQEHAQKEGLRFPTYDTKRSGLSHMPIFVSTVEIGGKSYQGQEAKTKKMAEMNAAKVAYICLTTCQETQSSNFSDGETSDASSFNLQPDVTGKMEEDVAIKSNISSKEQAQETQDKNGKRHRSPATSEDEHARDPPPDPIVIVIPPAKSSLIRKILVRPRTPYPIIPEGYTILPCSDDEWVAMAKTVPEEECAEYNN